MANGYGDTEPVIWRRILDAVNLRVPADKRDMYNDGDTEMVCMKKVLDVLNGVSTI